MADEPKEIMSQEDIDAYIASVREGEEKQTSEKLAQNSEEPPPTDDASDELKEIMTQEEIDAYIASVKAKEEKEKQEKEVLQQQAPTEKPGDKPSTADDKGAVSQGDIDALIAQQQEQESQAPQTNQNDSGAVSQSDIDALIAQQQEQEAQNTQQEQKESGEVSQSDIDALIAQQQEQEAQTTLTEQDDSAALSQSDMGTMIIQQQEQGDPEGELLQQKLDNIFAQKESEAPVEEKQDVWEELDHDILSQDEIDALLTGFQGEETSPASSIDAAIAQQKSPPPDSVDDITVISRQQHIERQRKKEENIIRKKQKASALIKELLRMEGKRIQSTLANKDKMVNEDLYARYEITRADRTKMIVSMSEKTANEYRSMHPGCCIYRI